jgi:hypothetical protein
MTLWLKSSLEDRRIKLKVLWLPWFVFVAPTLLMLLLGPRCDLVSIRNEAQAAER